MYVFVTLALCQFSMYLLAPGIMNGSITSFSLYYLVRVVSLFVCLFAWILGCTNCCYKITETKVDLSKDEKSKMRKSVIELRGERCLESR